MTRRLMTAGLFFLMSSAGFAQQLRETQVLTSNNIIALAGSGDTLWIATERGFNYRIGFLGDTWHGFEDSELSHRLWGFAFGGGGAAAVVGNSSSGAHHNYIGFWHFDHTRRRQQERYFGFPASLQNENGDLPVPTGGAVYAGGSFWTPFGRGGMVRYNPEDNTVHIIPSQNIGGENVGGTDTGDVLSLDVLRTGAGSGDLILVTTPAVIWTYDPNNGNWHALHGVPVLSSTAQENFISFNAAFYAAQNETSSTLYSFIITAPVNENNAAAVLYRFDDNEGQWFKALDRRERFSVFPAAGGSMYTLFEGNAVSLYADIDDAAAGGDGYLSEILNRDQFRQMLARAGNDPSPRVNDILFLPRLTDSSGTLAVATTTGLYISENVEPLRGAGGHGGFTLTHYVREVGAGQAYALPGIMRASAGGIYDRSVFVYRLKNDGNVTIRVYDYNMSLVRTVTRGERRSSSAQRSTDPSRDFWDGTNQAGHRVSPGVYYFRITSTGGDRFIGRVVVAK